MQRLLYLLCHFLSLYFKKNKGLSVKVRIFIIILSLFSQLYCSFNTLSDLQEYACYYPECPKVDDDNWANPKYISFYESMENLSFFKRLKDKIIFSSAPKFDWDQFEGLLKSVTKQRDTKKTKRSFPVERKILLNQGCRCIIYGDLHGAFHSLVRDLDELKKIEIINENLEISAKDCYLIFMGDLVSRSPYSIETLCVALVLMNKNPGKVIYLRGNHERQKHWEGFSMYRALEVQLKHKRSTVFKSVPLVKEINKFFSTLSDILYINHDNSKEKMCCFYSDVEIKKDFLSDINMQLVLKGEQRIEAVYEVDGLSFMGYLGNTSQWSLLSCPIHVYQKFFGFYKDAFVELLIGSSISNSVFTLHNRDVRTKHLFKRTHYSPIFGYELKSKNNDISNKKIIKVGCTLCLSGIAGPRGCEAKVGLEAALALFNKEDNNILIRPIIFDDGYIPRKAHHNVKNFYNKYGIDMILIPTGTPTLSSYLNMVKSGKIAVLFPDTGASQFRRPEIKNIIHFRPSYNIEVKYLIDYLIEEQKLEKFAFFYQDDSFGRPVVASAHDELEIRELKKPILFLFNQKQDIKKMKWIDVPYLRTQKNFSTQAKKVTEFMSETIGCFSTHFPTIELINQLGSEYFLGRIIFYIEVMSDAFRNFLKKRGIKSVCSFGVPDPNNSLLEIAKEHRSIMKKLGRHINANSLGGYIHTSLFIEALKHIEFPFTKEKIIKYLESIKDYSFKGLKLNFDPTIRGLSKSIWLKTPENKWIER